MKKILHIVGSDKFTIGYIKYMLSEIRNVEHFFITNESNYIKKVNTEFKDSLLLTKSVKDIFENRNSFFNSFDKIIVSGVFDLEKFIFFLPNKILKKMYLQFWGGDFYSHRNTRLFSKRFIHKLMLHSCIKRCGGILNLIDDDYKELSKIFPNNNKHYTMMMPGDPDNMNIYDKYSLKKSKVGSILLGNSATEENCHIEILKKLEHLKKDNIEIICPLSYGDKDYANEVISIGNKIFGKKFIPITDYMCFDDYLKLISGCSIAIFNNNRQQAMGNINAMLTFGKKVYIRDTTPMWKEYKSNNIIVFNVKDLDGITYDELTEFNEKDSISNNKNMKLREKNMYDNLNRVIDLIINE